MMEKEEGDGRGKIELTGSVHPIHQSKSIPLLTGMYSQYTTHSSMLTYCNCRFLGPFYQAQFYPVLEFLNNLWRLGTE
jgi:hypothetical protein